MTQEDLINGVTDGVVRDAGDGNNNSRSDSGTLDELKAVDIKFTMADFSKKEEN